MKKQQLPENDYLRQLEAKERRKKRTRLLLVGSAVIAVGASALVFPQMLASGGKVRYESYLAGELSQEKVKKILASDRNRLVIRYPGKAQQDTILSYSDYLALVGQNTVSPPKSLPVAERKAPEELDSLSLAFAVDQEYVEVIDLHAETVTNGGEGMETPNQIYGFRMTGPQLVGETLSIQIVNFDPDVQFDLDFGNGVRQSQVERLTTYTYPEPGSYFVKLIVREEGKPASIHASAEIVIAAPATVEEPLQSKSLASQTAINLQAISSLRAPRPSGNPIDPAQVSAPEKVAAPTHTKPLLAAEKMPSFPGGKDAMNRYISQNIRYPYPKGDANRKEGRTLASFVVGPSGEILQPKIMKSLGEAYDREVIRILNQMPLWEPGEQEGEKVPVYYQIMINFDLIGN